MKSCAIVTARWNSGYRRMLRRPKTLLMSVFVLCVTSVGLLYSLVRFSAGYASVVKTNQETMTAYATQANDQTKQKTVVLYSNQRSGSSFMGEFFNRNQKAFYLYEPLFPFTPHCDFLNEERIEALELMMRCNFSENANFFRLANDALKSNDDRNAKPCATVCFPLRSQAIRRRMQLGIQSITDKPLRPTIKASIVSKLCNESSLIAYKVLRICDLRDVDRIYKRLSRQGKELYIVHLVRDPRGIISSKLQLELKTHKMEIRTKELCTKMERNLLLANDTSEPLDFIRDGRYLLVRYEDAATDPVGIARNVYRFLGLDMPEEVHRWLGISVTLSSKLEKKDIKLMQPHQYQKLLKTLSGAYGTIKDASVTICKWRKLLNIDAVSKIQNICRTVLERFNYKAVWSKDALLDMDRDLWR